MQEAKAEIDRKGEEAELKKTTSMPKTNCIGGFRPLPNLIKKAITFPIHPTGWTAVGGSPRLKSNTKANMNMKTIVHLRKESLLI